MANFKLQTDKLKSNEMKVYITFLKFTETDWQSIHIYIQEKVFLPSVIRTSCENRQ